MPSTRSGQDMENSVFVKSRNREEYIGQIAKLILHIRGTVVETKSYVCIYIFCLIDTKNKAPNTDAPPPDPINALTNLASQGSRNPMQSQMMALGGPNAGNQGSNVLQNLIHVILELFVLF